MRMNATFIKRFLSFSIKQSIQIQHYLDFLKKPLIS
jgi:hypothetical protein